MARQTIHYPVLDLSIVEDKRRLVTKIGPLIGKYEVWLEPRRGTRSQQQNRYYWGVCIKTLVDYMRDSDYDIVSPDECHEFLKQRFLTVPVINKATGEQIGQRVRSTTGLSVTEMADYIDRVIVFEADYFGIVVPEPEWRSEQLQSH